MSMTIVDSESGVIPAGYTAEDVAQCKALSEQIVQALHGVKGHVGISVMLTTYNHLLKGYGPEARFQAGQHLITVGADIANAAIDAGGVCKDPGESPAAIAQQISNVIATKRHGPALDALLLVFETLARKFTCCAGMASAGAAQVAIALARVADEAKPADGAQRLH